MRIANATNGLRYEPYDEVSMFLSTHGHNYKMGYFRIDAMPYKAVIHLLKGGHITMVDATPSDKQLPDAFKFGMTTWALVFNRALRSRVRFAPWVTREMVRCANSKTHYKLIQRIRRLMAICGSVKPLIYGDNVFFEVHRQVDFDDKPELLGMLLEEK